MRGKIPAFAEKEQLFDYLRANKKRLIAEKTFKAFKSYSDHGIVKSEQAKQTAQKAGEPIHVVEVENEEINVSIIGNTYNWCDSQFDVLYAGCATKTIKELGVKGKDLVYHLKNHDVCIDDRVGYLTDIYEKKFLLTDLGLGMVGETTCLVFDSLVKKELCEKTFIQYKDGKIKQHSIGLQYMKIVLCINDTKDAEHYANWIKYFDPIINKDFVIQEGFFWAVTEIKLFEVSVVLWGANEITPMNPEKKNTEPTTVTQDTPQPTNHVTELAKKEVNVLDLIHRTQIIKAN